MKNAVNKSNYIFMYMLETDNQEMMEYAYKLSQIKQCQIIYIHKNNILPFENAENVYGISPNEFLEYMNSGKTVKESENLKSSEAALVSENKSGR